MKRTFSNEKTVNISDFWFTVTVEPYTKEVITEINLKEMLHVGLKFVSTFP